MYSLFKEKKKKFLKKLNFKMHQKTNSERKPLIKKLKYLFKVF